MDTYISADRQYELDTIKQLVERKAAAETIQDERERYQETSTVSHLVHNFVTGGDLMFRPSDLDTKVDGEWRYEKIRREVKARRRVAAWKAGLL